MYKRVTNRQLTLEGFDCPIGMHLDASNRWIQKAAIIPWSQIEDHYASLFPGIKGVVAKPLRMALGALLIQKSLNCSDRELVEQIKENPYLQYFIGLPGYTYEAPFAPSLLVEFRKRLNADILGEINELIIIHNQPEPPSPLPSGDRKADAQKSGESSNRGTLTLDATCAPQNISFPQDTSLLNTAREKAEKLIRHASKETGTELPRMYSNVARKAWLSFARNRKRGVKKVRKAIKKQLQFLRRDLGYLHDLISNGYDPALKQYRQLRTIEAIYSQQKGMYESHSHKTAHRIISFSQPYLRPIVRGKAKSPVEFGAKLDLSVVEGLCRIEHMSFDAYNESKILKTATEHYYQREGCYPERILADKIYRNRENLKYCKEHGIRLLGPALGRPRKDEKPDKDKAQKYKGNTDRIEVERKL